MSFCSLKQEDPICYNETVVIEFLTALFEQKLCYSAINTARCTLSTFLVNDFGITIGASSIVKRFMKGTFELRPPMVRYKFIWDINIVLEFLENYYPDVELPLDLLTYKLVMLLALSTKQRIQTLQAVNINDVKFFYNCVIIPIRSILKHSTQRNHEHTLSLQSYPNPSVCVVSCLRQYMAKTSNIRGTCTQLLISFNKPHSAVSKDTIGRWIKRVMFEAGIDTSLFKAHSTRAAASSAAKRDNYPIEHILKSAGWSNHKTFEKFYDKIIV